MPKPTIEGDEGATVTGDAETGFVVKPSEGKKMVEVSIPQGGDAAKVTVEVSTKVASVKPNGAQVRIVSEGTTLEGLGTKAPAATKAGDGASWSSPITVKDGNAAFYSIGVGKGE